MAQPFISLGLKATNFLVDKHFDKVPDAALHPETYHPANLTSKQRRQRTAEKRRRKNKKAAKKAGVNSNSSSDSSSPDGDDDTNSIQDRGASPVDKLSEDAQQQPLRGAPRSMFSPVQTHTPPQQTMYDGPPIYSNEPPRLRPEYAPSPPPINPGYPYAQGAYAPPPLQPQPVERRSRRDSYGDEDYYSDSYRKPRRPKAVSRRSSSYHGPRSSAGGDQQLARRGTGSDHLDRARDKAHKYGLKEEVEGFFTKSKPGLAGSAVGAIVGGWAAHKAQEAKGREKHKTSPLFTLLGAAVGGLAVNAVVEKWEESRENTAEEQGKWNEKFDRGADSDGGKSERSHGSRRDRTSRGDSRYVDGYGSDSESDGGRSHRSRRSRKGTRGGYTSDD
jgi:hypothetical protein